MKNYSSNVDHNTSSFDRCQQLDNFRVFAQWKNEYLSPAVFYNSIAAVTVNSLLMIVTTISNALIIFCILANRRYRRQSFMKILCSLSTTDFLVGSVVQPLFIVCRISELKGRLDLVCRARQVQAVAGAALLGISLAHSCFISAERYLAVRFPIRYKTFLKNGRVIVILLLIWFSMTTYSLRPFIGFPKTRELIRRSVVVAVIIVVTAAFYVGTFYQFGAGKSRREKNLEKPEQTSRHLSKVDRANVPKFSRALLKRKKEKKLARTMLIVVGVLAFCYLPEMITYPLLPKNEEEMSTSWIVLCWKNTLLFLNSFINPFLYCWRIPELKKSILQVVKRKNKVVVIGKKHAVWTPNQNVKDQGLVPNDAGMPSFEQAKELNPNKLNRLPERPANLFTAQSPSNRRNSLQVVKLI